MITLPVHRTSEFYKISPTKIICLGLNYHDHIKESEKLNMKISADDIPAEPVIFNKTPNVLTPHGSSIILPAFIREYKFDKPRTDYEAELAFIIKDKCRNVPKENAFQYILGFTCFNDVSQRNIQAMDKGGWFRGKSFDTYGAIGPKLILTKDIGDAQNLNIRCRLNGKIVQNSNTKFMIFTIPEILSFITKNFTLEPGDIISTGTPAGVGPLQNKDTVEVEIENIGVLKNNVIEEE